MEDEYYGIPGTSAVRLDSDVIIGKPHTDLVITGTAHAHRRQAITCVDVRVAYERRLMRHLRVTGDRTWRKGLTGWYLSAPTPFVSMPVTYDRAFGGSDERGSEPRNRSGLGYSSSVNSKYEGTACANIEFPDQLVSSPSDRPQPAGLGVIAKHW